MRFKQIAYVSVLNLLILTGSVTAQINFSKIVIDTNFIQYSMPFDILASDLNGDDEIDLVLTSPDYTTGENSILLWYQNDGNEIFSKNIIDTLLGGSGMIDVSDLDGDLDNDIILTGSDRIYWYSNNGNGVFADTIIDFMLLPRDPVIIDFDDDSDKDIVTASHDGIFWQNNDGNENFDIDTIDVIRIYDGGFSVTDIDEDSDNDVVTRIHIENENQNHLVWYRNNGNENFTREQVDTTIYYIQQIIVDDLDDDGDKDIIALDDKNNDSSAVVWYQNDGDENFIRDTVSFDFERIPRSVYIADVDNDNDKDVMVTGGNNAVGEVVYYENDGSENFTKHTIDDTEGNRKRIIAADIDKDGDMDLFVTNNYPFEVLFYRNDGLMNHSEELNLKAPGTFHLAQNYPNPFNPSTKIGFMLPKSGRVKLQIYDLSGQTIETLINGPMKAGHHEIEFVAKNLSSGIYFYKIEVGDPARRTGEFQDVRKMILLR